MATPLEQRFQRRRRFGGGPAPASATDARGGRPGAGRSHSASAPDAGRHATRGEPPSGCLNALAAGSWQVLVLRPGIGLRAPLSRGAVAERVEASVRQIAGRARRACGSNPAAVTPAPVAGGEPPAVVAEPGSTHAIGDAAPTGRSGVEEEFRSGQARIVRVGGDDGPPILLVLAFLDGFSAVWALQHRGGRVA